MTSVSRVSAQTILISEIYPAPLSGEAEWVELYNPTHTAISLGGYTLKDVLTTPSVLYTSSSEALNPLSYTVITLSGSKLNNTGDTVQLLDQNGTLIDAVSYPSSTAGQSWQRMQLGSNESINGTPTPGGVNPLFPLVAPTVLPSPSSTATTSAFATAPTSPQATTSALPTSPSPTPTLPSSPTPLPTASTPPSPPATNTLQLLLSEFHPCPEGGAEWLELYNPTTELATFAGMRVTDESGNYRTLSGTVPAKGYAAFSWSGSLLNNAGDSFEISTTQGHILGQAEFSACESTTAYVYTITPTASWKKAIPTPGMTNQPPLTQSSTHAHVTKSAEDVHAHTASPAALSSSIIPKGTLKTSSPVLPTLVASKSAIATTAALMRTADASTPQVASEKIDTALKYLLVLSCIGCITSGTLVMYGSIKKHSLALD